MEDIKESTKAKSQTGTSATKASRQSLSPSQNTAGGVKLPTGEKAEKEAEKIRDLLAKMKDVTHSWPCKLPDVTGELTAMHTPFISTEYIFFAFPLKGHVIKNAVTSDKKQNFLVDGVLVIPVTSE